MITSDPPLLLFPTASHATHTTTQNPAPNRNTESPLEWTVRSPLRSQLRLRSIPSSILPHPEHLASSAGSAPGCSASSALNPLTAVRNLKSSTPTISATTNQTQVS